MKQFLVVFILFYFFGCTKENNEKAPDISQVKSGIKIFNMNKYFFETDSSVNISNMNQLLLNYPLFLKYYLGIDSLDTEMYNELLTFRKDSKVNELYQEQKKVFYDFNKQNGEIDKAFRYFKYYFPDHFVPEVYYFFTSYIYEILASDSIILISPEFFFGTDYKYLGQFYEYQKRRFRPEYILPKTLYEYGIAIQSEFDSKVLLSQMIFHGRALYFSKKMLPEVEDTLIFGFNKIQLDWCIKNEKNIWAFFNTKNLLFNEEKFRTQKFIQDAPTTNELPSESPGRTGHWVGYKIVEKYICENTEISLKDLMKEKDFREIFKGAKYKPR